MKSHPVWVCGLKHTYEIKCVNKSKSHPVWVCGLKHQNSSHDQRAQQVTPCMGVWIETTFPLRD